MVHTDLKIGRQMTALAQTAERIIRQTMEALLFEGIVEAGKDGSDWTFYGTDAEGKTVSYRCVAEEKRSFGRVKIAVDSIRREGEPCDDLYLFLEEVVSNRLDGELTASFARELVETLAKDGQFRAIRRERIPDRERHYEALESHMTDGHPYHPSYKSRIGFSLKDNERYGPEFDQPLSLEWVAVDERLVDVALSPGESAERVYGLHLAEEERLAFAQALKERGDPDIRYILLPVHPWQSERQLPSLFPTQLAAKAIVPLGPSAGDYRAQQSIRTLSSRDSADAPYVKLALSITNTSTSRILAHHTTQNAPLVSEWLRRIIDGDATLRRERFGILRETMGVSFRYERLPQLQYRLTYGTLGAIFRENVSLHLEEGEEAWPLNALSLVQANGEPFLREAIGRYGIEAWSSALVRVLIVPIVHLLYAHGIALECHGQNLILVVKDGFPVRLLAKDLHDGVRYCTAELASPDLEPKLWPEPESHRKFNRYSFLRAESASDVRDYTYDAFFFICMTDVCFALERLGLSEEAFWRKCAETIREYQREHPELSRRFETFDLLSPDGLIEEMTRRRIYGDGKLYFRKAPNPLRSAWESLP